MAEADLSKIVGMIMENPELIKQIKGLANASGETPTAAEEVSVKKEDFDEKAEPVYIKETSRKSGRKDLLNALKPYVSKERAQAIDSMLSIADVLEIMKTR